MIPRHVVTLTIKTAYQPSTQRAIHTATITQPKVPAKFVLHHMGLMDDYARLHDDGPRWSLSTDWSHPTIARTVLELQNSQTTFPQEDLTALTTRLQAAEYAANELAAVWQTFNRFALEAENVRHRLRTLEDKWQKTADLDALEEVATLNRDGFDDLRTRIDNLADQVHTRIDELTAKVEPNKEAT